MVRYRRQGTYPRGLEGIIADEDGNLPSANCPEGQASDPGRPDRRPGATSDSEEVTYLLLDEKLPTASQLAEWRDPMRASRAIPAQVRG